LQSLNHKKVKTVSLLFLLTFLFLASGCSKKNDNPVSSGTTSSNDISIQDMAFSPSNMDVAVGTTIKWTNKDAITHTVTSGSPGSASGIFDSGNISQNGNFSFTFSQAGTFSYCCKIHPMMIGTITVK
jgi:plastocyanin